VKREEPTFGSLTLVVIRYFVLLSETAASGNVLFFKFITTDKTASLMSPKMSVDAVLLDKFMVRTLLNDLSVIVDRRWAIAITVLPCISSSKLS